MNPTSRDIRRRLLGPATLAFVLGACSGDPSPATESGGASGSGGRTGEPGTGGSGGRSDGGTGGSAVSGSGGSSSGGQAGTTNSGSGGSTTGSGAVGGRAMSGSGGSSSGGQAGATNGGGTGGRAMGSGGGAGAGGRGGAGAGSAGRAGTAGSAGIGGPSLCAGSNYLICEDFEATAVGGVPTGWTKHGDATVQADQAARGSHALKIGAAASGERRIYADAAKLGSGHWGRIFYKVQLPAFKPPSGSVVHSTLVAFQGNGPKNGNSEYRVVDTVEDSNGKHQFLWNVQPTSVGEFGKGSSYNWMYDGNWHCAEWHVDGPTQSYHFYIDGAEVPEVAIDNGAGNYNGTDIPNAFSQVHVGWNNYQSASPGFVAWIDEIAMDASRVGCGN
jgi:hypothetical protein